jgi:hypothetical protein
MLARRILPIGAVAVALCGRGPALAADAGTPGPAATVSAPTTGGLVPETGLRPRDAGVVDGQIVSVDYQKGMLSVQTASRGRIDVLVLPSTSIQGKGNEYHSISDLTKGQRVSIFASQIAGRYTAQIIRLR